MNICQLHPGRSNAGKKRSQTYKWGCLSFASKNQSPMLLQGIYTIPAGDEQTDKMKNASKPIKNAISTTDFYWRFFSVLCMNGPKNPSTTSLYIAVIDASYGVAYLYL